MHLVPPSCTRQVKLRYGAPAPCRWNWTVQAPCCTPSCTPLHQAPCRWNWTVNVQCVRVVQFVQWLVLLECPTVPVVASTQHSLHLLDWTDSHHFIHVQFDTKMLNICAICLCYETQLYNLCNSLCYTVLVYICLIGQIAGTLVHQSCRVLGFSLSYKTFSFGPPSLTVI